MPCVEIRDPAHGRVYVDRLGYAWDGLSNRVPECDTAAALEPSLSAEEVGRVLAGMWREAADQWLETTRDGLSGKGIGQHCVEAAARSSRADAIADCARALGVLAAFEKARGG